MISNLSLQAQGRALTEMGRIVALPHHITSHRLFLLASHHVSSLASRHVASAHSHDVASALTSALLSDRLAAQAGDSLCAPTVDLSVALVSDLSLDPICRVRLSVGLHSSRISFAHSVDSDSRLVSPLSFSRISLRYATLSTFCLSETQCLSRSAASLSYSAAPLHFGFETTLLSLTPESEQATLVLFS